MQKKTLSIHSENILPIIKKWLYSDKDIFLRELVSNACDALNKVKILLGVDPGSISIRIDKGAKTISITDTGIGMSAEEVEKYIAQIAFSGAEEFVSKYKTQTEKEPIIGHFGLGFYSAYMVASKVEIDTRSHAGAPAAYWVCDGTSSYSMDVGKREARGTEITLHIEEDSLEYLEESKLRELLNRHCKFLPFPIELNGHAIGNQTPLWMKNSAECTDKEYLEFYRSLFPMDPEPIFWIHLNVDYPFTLKGILYFPKIHRRFDAKEGAIKLFCNRVFVSDNCKDILPDYLTILRGALDSPDIPLNVSRSYLQVDKNVRQLSSHISKKIADRLATLYRTERQKFIDFWPDIEMIIKLGALQDDKFFERVRDLILWKNGVGDWTNLADYLERNPGGKVLYAVEEKSASIVPIYKEKKIEFLYSHSYIDTALINFLEEKHSCKFQRLDGQLGEELLDVSREKNLLDAEGKTESVRIADFIQKALNKEDVDVEAKSLISDELPGVLVLKEEERRLRDYMTLTQGKVERGFRPKKTFVVNTNNKLIQTLSRLEKGVATDLARHLYDLSLLSARELEGKEVEEVLSRQTAILGRLVDLLP